MRNGWVNCQVLKILASFWVNKIKIEQWSNIWCIFVMKLFDYSICVSCYFAPQFLWIMKKNQGHSPSWPHHCGRHQVVGTETKFSIAMFHTGVRQVLLRMKLNLHLTLLRKSKGVCLHLTLLRKSKAVCLWNNLLSKLTKKVWKGIFLAQ